MSYTNSTPNLHLPQYIATDKPTYLGDWNASMQTIDTVITATQATANGANSTAISANSTAQTAQQSANTANTKADNNATEIASIKDMFTKTSLTINTASSDYNWVGYSANMNNFSFNLAFNSAVSNLQNKGTVQDSNTLNVLFSINQNIFKLETGAIGGNNNKELIGFSRRYETDSVNVIYGTIIKAYWDGANTIFYSTIPTSTINLTTQITVWGNITVLL